MIGIFISVGLLWLLLIIYSPTTDAHQSKIETWSVILSMQLIQWFTQFALAPFIGPLVLLVQVGALYLLVDKICDLDRSRTIRICAWYLGVIFLLNLLILILIS